MVIKKQPIISWLLRDKIEDYQHKIGVPCASNPQNIDYLINSLNFLSDVQNTKPEWGFPEFVMPSFQEVMAKSAKSFFKIDNELFQDFYNENVCGILILKDLGTLVYGFSENTLHVWLFITYENKSMLYLYFYVVSTKNNTRKIFSCPTLIGDEQMFYGNLKVRQELYETITNFIIIYLATKKFVEIETIEIAPGKVTKLDETVFPYGWKEKIRNDSGQIVIVMDSRWFRKIVNNNEIFVRGYLKLQPKKDFNGIWYKELIFVEPHKRLGYHRNAKIENGETDES